jgi:hypothetical protein
MRPSRPTDDPALPPTQRPRRQRNEPAGVRHPPHHDTGADPAEHFRPERPEAPDGAPNARYTAALVWPLACLALYAWELIGIAGG